MIIFNLQLLFVRVSGAETLFFLHWAFMVMLLFFSVCIVLLLRLHLVCVDQKEKNCSHENQFSSISQIKGVVRWESLTTTNGFFPPTHPCLAFQLFPRGKFPCSQSEVEEQKSLDSLIKEQMKYWLTDCLKSLHLHVSENWKKAQAFQWCRPQVCGTSDSGDLVVNSCTFSVPPEQNLTFGHQIQTPTHLWYHEFPPRHRWDVLFLRTRLRLNLADLVHWPLKSNQSKPKSRRTSAQALAALVGGEKTNKGTRSSSGGLLKFSVTAVSAGSHSLRGYSLSALQRKTSSC